MTCRTDLPELKRVAHPGLYLGRYFNATGTERAAVVRDALTKYEVPDFYGATYGCWKTYWESKPSTVVHQAALDGRLAIGLGNASPLEIGLALHHTYGTPIIPGSAVKNACLRGIRRLAELGHLDEAAKACAEKVVSGSTSGASYCHFEDAWWVPSNNGNPFVSDVITVHHQKYYSNGDAPSDFEDPIPVPFVTIRPGTQFLFVIQTPAGWATFVKRALAFTLEHDGIGAKTASGYGRFTITGEWHEPEVETVEWPGCLLSRKKEGCTFTMHIKHGDENHDMDASHWDRLPCSKTFPVSPKELNDAPVTVTVRAEICGPRTTIKEVILERDKDVEDG